MRNTVFLLILTQSCFHAFGQNVNPFESIGKEGHIITLSKGKYLEIENNDSLQRIGSVVVNMYTGQLYEILDSDTLYKGSNINPTIVTRWWSIDPLAAKYPSQSPYAFCNNNPVIYNDVDGRSGVITIIPGANGNPGTISISFDVVMYGSGADQALAVAAQNDLMNLVNSQNLKYMLNGQEYTVQLDLKINYHSESSAFAEASGFFENGDYRRQGDPNGDYAKNFVRVENVNQAQKAKGDADPFVAKKNYSNKQGYVSEWMGGLGGNSGFLISGNFSKDYTELLHELWHGLFGEHSDIPSDIAEVMLMFSAEMEASKFTSMPKETLILDQNKVLMINEKLRNLTVEDMNILFENLGFTINSSRTGADGVPLQTTGAPTEFTLGTLNNNYYNRDGVLDNNANSRRSE